MIVKEHAGKRFFFNESPQANDLINEIFSDNYKIFSRKISFSPGDVVLDIGACEGMFAILIAKTFPFVRVVALEPVSRTFWQLVRNIGANGITNIEAYNVGVGGKREDRLFAIGQSNWNGGSSGVMTFDPALHEQTTVKTISLDDVFKDYNIDKCRLLKMDIEGMEYEALYPSTMLDKVDYMVAEFHINQKLQEQARDISELATWVGEKTNLLYFERCVMAA